MSEPRVSSNVGFTELNSASPNFEEAIANGQLIIEAVAAYRYLLEKYGPEWKEKYDNYLCSNIR